MSQELRWRDESWLENENVQSTQQANVTPKYQDYQQIETINEKRVEELFFFSQVFVFCLTMTSLSFAFLSFGLNAPLTLILALPLSTYLSYRFKKILMTYKK